MVQSSARPQLKLQDHGHTAGQCVARCASLPPTFLYHQPYAATKLYCLLLVVIRCKCSVNMSLKIQSSLELHPWHNPTWQVIYVHTLYTMWEHHVRYVHCTRAIITWNWNAQQHLQDVKPEQNECTVHQNQTYATWQQNAQTVAGDDGAIAHNVAFVGGTKNVIRSSHKTEVRATVKHVEVDRMTFADDPSQHFLKLWNIIETHPKHKCNTSATKVTLSPLLFLSSSAPLIRLQSKLFEPMAAYYWIKRIIFKN